LTPIAPPPPIFLRPLALRLATTLPRRAADGRVYHFDRRRQVLVTPDGIPRVATTQPSGGLPLDETGLVAGALW